MSPLIGLEIECAADFAGGELYAYTLGDVLDVCRGCHEDIGGHGGGGIEVGGFGVDGVGSGADVSPSYDVAGDPYTALDSFLRGLGIEGDDFGGVVGVVFRAVAGCCGRCGRCNTAFEVEFGDGLDTGLSEVFFE